MSAQILGVADIGRSGERRLAEVRPIRPSGAWDPDRFARAQIRGLVRQIFSINTNRPVKQLVLSAVDQRLMSPTFACASAKASPSKPLQA